MKNIRSFILAVVVCTFPAAQPCFAIGILPIQMTHPDELVLRSSDITVSRIVGANYDKGTVFYTFEVIECIKGDLAVRHRGIIRGRPAGDRAVEIYDDHRDKSFWRRSAGRMFPDPGNRIHPSFSVGTIYLMFHNRPYHVKSFECIRLSDQSGDEGDRWLEYVRDAVKKPETKSKKSEQDTDPNRVAE